MAFMRQREGANERPDFHAQVFFLFCFFFFFLESYDYKFEQGGSGWRRVQ